MLISQIGSWLVIPELIEEDVGSPVYHTLVRGGEDSLVVIDKPFWSCTMIKTNSM